MRKVSKGDISSESGDSSDNELIQNNLEDSEQLIKAKSRVPGRTMESVMLIKAWALLRGSTSDHLVTSKDILLGRNESSQTKEGTQYIQVSKSKKVSRRAARIRFDEDKE